MILITGVSGFLGSRLARLLLARGHQVRGTFRPGDDLRLLQGLDVQAVPCDLLDRDATHAAVQGVEVVFHVAAWITFEPQHYEAQLKVNVEGTRLIVEACLAAGVRRLVYTSTVSTLGIPPAGSVGHEGTPYNWGPWRLGYMDSKKAAQDLVSRAHAEQGLDVVSLLPGTFFGPGDLNLNAGQYIVQGARGLLRVAPPGGTTAVHVDDVARGHLLALERGRAGRRYILGGDNLTFSQLFGIIASQVGRTPPLLTLPAAALRGPTRAADWLRRHAGVDLPLTEGLAVAACERLYYSSWRARRELGCSFRPAAAAVADAVSWYRKRDML